MLSTVWNTQRASWSSIEKRGRKEIEVTRRRGRGVKSRETNLASNKFPKCSPQTGIPKEIHRVSREEKGEGGEIEVTWGRERRVERRDSNEASNHTPI